MDECTEEFRELTKMVILENINGFRPHELFHKKMEIYYKFWEWGNLNNIGYTRFILKSEELSKELLRYTAALTIQSRFRKHLRKILPSYCTLDMTKQQNDLWKQTFLIDGGDGSDDFDSDDLYNDTLYG